MILFLKMVSLGTNCAEGARPHHSSSSSACLNSRSPSLFDLATYSFANGNLLSGPFFEFEEWEAFIQRNGPFYEVKALLPTPVACFSVSCMILQCRRGKACSVHLLYVTVAHIRLRLMPSSHMAKFVAQADI
jgi:hypothetical protein